MESDCAGILAFKHTFEQISCANPSIFPENPTLCQGSLNFNQDPLPDEELNAFLEIEDPLSDPVIRAFCNGTDEDIGSGNLMQGNPVAGDNSGSIPVVSVPPQSQYNCIYCQRLRVITHTNGINVKRLEIHGNFGEISHAVLEIYSFDSSLPCQETQMFHFQESMERVKIFLIEYFDACKQEGYRTLEDPLLSFYQALAIGSDEPHDPNNFLPPLTNSDECANHQLGMLYFEDESNLGEMFMKIPLSMQRERTRNLKLKDLADYFNLPIEDAAKKLNICPTVMKKICRRHGMLRWPYRKIKSLERKISNKVRILKSSIGQERALLLEDIHKYHNELSNIYQTFTN